MKYGTGRGHIMLLEIGRLPRFRHLGLVAAAARAKVLTVREMDTACPYLKPAVDHRPYSMHPLSVKTYTLNPMGI